MKQRVISIILALAVAIAYSVPCVATNRIIADGIDSSDYTSVTHELADENLEIMVEELLETVEPDETTNVGKLMTIVDEVGNADVIECDERSVSNKRAETICEDIIEDSDTIEVVDSEDGDDDNYIIANTDSGISVINLVNNECTSIKLTEDNNVEVEILENVSSKSMVCSTIVVKVEEDIVYGQAYKSKVTEKYKEKYWYQNSDTGKYVRVGCDYKYRINYDSLPNSKADKVKKYRNSIDKTNTSWNAFEKSCNGFGISATGLAVAIAIAIAASGCTGGVSVIVGIVVGLIAGITYEEAKVIAQNYKNTADYYADVKSYYTTVKKYGTKY